MSIGTAGYPDGQRLEQKSNFDSEWTLTGPQVGSKLSPAIYLGNHGFVFIAARVDVTPTTLFLNWYLDKALTTILVTDAIALDPSINGVGSFTLAALGPWLQAMAFPLAGGAYTPNFHLFLANQARPWTATVLGQPVYDTGAVNLPAAGSSTVAAAQYASGLCGVGVTGGTQGVIVELDALRPVGATWAPFASWSVAAGVSDYRTVVLPPNATRMILTNPSGVSASNGNRVTVFQEV